LSDATQAQLVHTIGTPDGNERLTAMTGTILIVLFAVLGITILRIGQLICISPRLAPRCGPRERALSPLGSRSLERSSAGWSWRSS
jgi:hypothetical protein